MFAEAHLEAEALQAIAHRRAFAPPATIARLRPPPPSPPPPPTANAFTRRRLRPPSTFARRLRQPPRLRPPPPAFARPLAFRALSADG